MCSQSQLKIIIKLFRKLFIYFIFEKTSSKKVFYFFLVLAGAYFCLMKIFLLAHLNRSLMKKYPVNSKTTRLLKAQGIRVLWILRYPKQKLN